jgi:hypothetical protein
VAGSRSPSTVTSQRMLPRRERRGRDRVVGILIKLQRPRAVAESDVLTAVREWSP